MRDRPEPREYVCSCGFEFRDELAECPQEEFYPELRHKVRRKKRRRLR
jgi:hypothetical protein